MGIVEELEKEEDKFPGLRIGDTVRVEMKVVDKKRLQAFEGTLIRRRGNGPRQTITLRRISHGVGVERIIPLHSPLVKSALVVRPGRARRAKLYYLRNRVGKAARPEKLRKP